MSFDAIPSVAGKDAKILREFLRQLEVYARENGVVDLVIESYAYSGGGEELGFVGYEITKRLEFELRLDATEEELWKGMEYKRRKNIQKAQRLGITIQDLNGHEGLLLLRNLQAKSFERIVARGGPSQGDADYQHEDPARVFVNSGVGRITAAFLEGEVVSAVLFSNFNGLVYAHLSGHSQQGLKTQAGTLLYWESIKRYRLEGANRFNMGGCQTEAINEDSAEHGVYVYKKAFGTTCLECFSGRKTLRKTVKTIVTKVKALKGE